MDQVLPAAASPPLVTLGAPPDPTGSQAANGTVKRPQAPAPPATPWWLFT